VHLIYLIPPAAGIVLATAIGWLIERENVAKKEVLRGPDETTLHGPPDGLSNASGGPAIQTGGGDGSTAT
jgi:hypothetical protein